MQKTFMAFGTTHKKYASWPVGLLLAVFVLQAAYAVWDQAPTHDEPNWMTVAWYITHYWTWQGDYHVLMHPPLSFYLQGIPLRLAELWLRNTVKTPPEGPLAAQFPYPYSEVLSYDGVFTIAKLSMLPLAVLLGWYIYRWARQLYGVRAGLAALTLYVFNPYMLAYATILTADMTAACWIFIATYHFWQYCRQPSKWNLALTGVTLGLALLAKATAVLLLPVFGVLGASLYLFQRRGSARRWLIGLGLVIVIALFILEAGYLFDMQPVRSFRPEQSSDLLYQAFKTLPIPFGAFINGMRLQQSFFFWMTRQHFFAGHYADEPFWYYHFATLLLKNPVALTVLLLLSVFGGKFRRQNFIFRENFLILPALVVFLYFSFFFPITQDSRFVLPFYPFLCVFISRSVTFNLLKRTSVKIIGGVLLGWYILSTIAAAPHYLAYCNELIGGLENGYKWFASTGFDSGQDLKGLGRYLQAHQIPVVKLAYHGRAIPEYYGVRYVPLLEPEGCQPTKGLIAIGTTRLMGVNEANHACYDWLKPYEPIDKIGYTMFIYFIP